MKISNIPQSPIQSDRIKDVLKALQNKIDAIDADYAGKKDPPKVESPKFPELDLSVDSVYKEYDAPTDDELGQAASADLEEYKSKTESAIRDNAKDKTNAFNSAIDDLQGKYDATNRDTVAYYDAARKESSNSNLKRGLARSTMAQLSQDSLNASEASTRAGMQSSMDKNLAQLNSEIRNVETEREAALRDFDITYAAKLTQKLGDLEKTRAEKQAETLEYNNALKERLTKLAMEQEKWSQEYKNSQIDLEKKEEARAESYKKEVTDKRNKDVYDAVSGYLSGMTRAEARREFADPYFKSVLSPYHYSILSNALNSK